MPPKTKTVAEAITSIERLGKWRVHYAGWLLGTRSKGDPEAEWARDTAEKLLLLRAEMTTLTALMIEKGVFSAAEFTLQLGDEAEALMRQLEDRWPGVTATDSGLTYNFKKINMSGWMKNWLP